MPPAPPGPQHQQGPGPPPSPLGAADGEGAAPTQKRRGSAQARRAHGSTCVAWCVRQSCGCTGLGWAASTRRSSALPACGARRTCARRTTGKAMPPPSRSRGCRPFPHLPPLPKNKHPHTRAPTQNTTTTRARVPRLALPCLLVAQLVVVCTASQLLLSPLCVLLSRRTSRCLLLGLLAVIGIAGLLPLMLGNGSLPTALVRFTRAAALPGQPGDPSASPSPSCSCPQIVASFLLMGVAFGSTTVTWVLI